MEGMTVKKVTCGDRFCIFLGNDIDKSVPVACAPQRLAPLIKQTKEKRSKSQGKRQKSHPPRTNNLDKCISLASSQPMEITSQNSHDKNRQLAPSVLKIRPHEKIERHNQSHDSELCETIKHLQLQVEELTDENSKLKQTIDNLQENDAKYSKQVYDQLKARFKKVKNKRAHYKTERDEFKIKNAEIM